MALGTFVGSTWVVGGAVSSFVLSVGISCTLC